VTDPGSSASGLLGYYIFRADKGAATPLATIAAGTTNYNDTGLTPGTPYTYWVTAVDKAGNQSQPESNHYTGTPT
jgi:predicted phage tail protein